MTIQGTESQLPADARPDGPLEAILNTAMDAVIVMRSDGHVQDWNEVASSIFGISCDEAVGARLSDLIIPLRYRDAHRQGLQRFLNTGAGPLLKTRVEVSALRKDGVEFPVELSITPFEDGGDVVFLGFLRDITGRKNEEAALQRRLLQAKLIYEVVSFAAGTASFEAALSKCLDAVHQLTGWPVGHVYLPSEADPTLLVPSQVWFTEDPARFKRLRRVTAETKLSIGDGLPGRVISTGLPVWIADVHKDERFPRAKSIADLDISSALAFPIKNGESVIAVVEFFTPVQTEPEPELLLTLRSIGDQVGRVFERHRAEQRLQAHADQQKMLMAELNHRVKNMLAVVTGLATQTMRNSTSMEEFNSKFLERLRALTQTHGLLASNKWKSAGLKELIDEVASPYREAKSQITIEGPDVELTSKTALALSLVFHELLTNSAKYGALSRQSGALSVTWTSERGLSTDIVLHWVESGLAGVTSPARSGFGSRLIQSTVAHQLHGKVEAEYRDEGLRCTMTWPISSSRLSPDA